MKKLLFILPFLLLSHMAQAKDPVINFEERVHNFGTIQEADGKATTVFKYTNTGKTPLVISKVQASCGCTAPSWEKMPIEPGQSGGITVTYDPYARPGKFAKSIYIYSNATEPQIRLMIKGDVIAKPVNLEDKYPIRAGDIGLQSNTVRFNNVKKGLTGYRIIEVMNFGTEPATITFNNPHKYIYFSTNTLIVAPKEVSRLHIRLESDECTEWGPINKEVTVLLNGEEKNFKLNIVANINEDFSKMTRKERANAPMLELKTSHVNLGKISPNKNHKKSIEIANKGINNLEIRNVINNNPELKAKIEKTSIESNKKTTLQLELIPNNSQAGTYRRTITLQSNDPQNAYQVINIAWEIEK